MSLLTDNDWQNYYAINWQKVRQLAHGLRNKQKKNCTKKVIFGPRKDLPNGHGVTITLVIFFCRLFLGHHCQLVDPTLPSQQQRVLPTPMIQFWRHKWTQKSHRGSKMISRSSSSSSNTWWKTSQTHFRSSRLFEK